MFATTPDAYLVTDKNELLVLEVKCPSSCENLPINVDYLENGNGYKLSKSRRGREIYTQIQFQLFFSKLKKGILFVYTSADQRIIPIDLKLGFI